MEERNCLPERLEPISFQELARFCSAVTERATPWKKSKTGVHPKILVQVPVLLFTGIN